MVELDRRGLVILATDECFDLLRPGGVGRLGWVRQGRPLIRPVNFAVDAGRIVIRTGPGAVLAAAESALPVTFEVDQTRNVDHTAWSVIVDGVIELLDIGAVPNVPLRSWAADDIDRFVQITVAEISGRRIGTLGP